MILIHTHGDGDRYHVHVHTNSRDRLRFLRPHFDTTDRYISMERKELGDVAVEQIEYRYEYEVNTDDPDWVRTRVLICCYAGSRQHQHKVMML